METNNYTVTDQAGPKVAGRAVSAGDTLALTEPEARAELLSGAIVPEGKQPPAEDAVRSPKQLADTQARARGADSAKAEAKGATAEPAPQS
ncbi:hypothetical protein [Methylorubrum zatmanii]